MSQLWPGKSKELPTPGIKHSNAGIGIFFRPRAVFLDTLNATLDMFSYKFKYFKALGADKNFLRSGTEIVDKPCHVTQVPIAEALGINAKIILGGNFLVVTRNLLYVMQF